MRPDREADMVDGVIVGIAIAAVAVIYGVVCIVSLIVERVRGAR